MRVMATMKGVPPKSMSRLTRLLTASWAWGVLIASASASAFAVAITPDAFSLEARSQEARPRDAAANTSSSLPPLPFVEQGACPFECCQYRDWRASRPVSAQEDWDNPRLNDRGRRKTVFGISRGETITAMTGLVMTTKAGRLRVSKDATLTSVPSRFPSQPPETVAVHAGDVIYLLVPHGENSYTVWLDGRVLEAVDLNDLIVAAVGQTSPAPKDVFEQPAYDWWVRVRNQQGDVGWTDRARDFHGADACSNALPSR